ncbi:carboxy terminal-processing peptidase [Oceanivirga miroungae]|uniref:Carboxyl-terminal protease n=1 Tax=Oceanivirga miroungae TaxID=1130046 RepID=A0A6I8MAB4_9FUSO|nr:carboxy terminal-processing peptidase [Oceanivirga miroungae]VWL85102.1 carboxyl-terminal protease [Oceanivirga miroungae]
MKKIKNIFFSIFILLSLLSFSENNVIKDDYKGAFNVSKYLIEDFSYNKNMKIDEKVSNFIFDSLIESLDPNKMLFTQKELKEFSNIKPVYAKLETDEILEVGIYVVNKYLDNIKRQYDYSLKLINKYDFDFNNDEIYYYDRKDLDYAKDLNELNKIWKKRVLNDVERLVIAGDKKEEIKKILIKRYKSNKNNILKMTEEEKNEIVINAFVRAFDPHNNWYSPSSSEDFEISQSLNLIGMGAQIQQRGESNIIAKLIDGGPAKRSNKFKVGDIFVYVGEGETGELVDVSSYRLKDLVKLIRGKENTVVRIGVRSSETAPVRIIRLVREKIKQEDEQIKSKIVDVDNKKVGYIIIPGFYSLSFDNTGRSVSEDLKQELIKLEKEKVESLVIDLRNNGGGSLSEVVKMLGYFIGNNKIAVQVKDEKGHVDKYYTNLSYDLTWKKPLVVMINRNSASASEIFAGAIKDYNRGIIVGTNTWGKGSVQSVKPLNFNQNGNKFELGIFKYTINMFFRANGSSTQVKGVAPNIEYIKLRSEIENGEDKEYKNALKWEKIDDTINEKYKFKLSKPIYILENSHKRRIKKDEKWKLVEEQIKYSNKEYDTKSTTLNLEKRKQKRKEKEKIQKAFKDKAIELGIPVETIFVLDNGLSYNEDDLEKQNKEKEILDEYIDPYTIESARISLDLI